MEPSETIERVTTKRPTKIAKKIATVDLLVSQTLTKRSYYSFNFLILFITTFSLPGKHNINKTGLQPASKPVDQQFEFSKL